ncbi:MAG: lysozyme family protein [Clostridiales bacterium]|nr:lysozyme family protein [Clostridiales bacterium]
MNANTIQNTFLEGQTLLQIQEYSIQVSIHYFSDCIKKSGCTGINDVDNLNMTLQAYNFGRALFHGRRNTADTVRTLKTICHK